MFVSMPRWFSFLGFSFLVLVGLSCPLGFAAADEPVGFDVAKRCVEVSGGTEAFEKIRSLKMSGSFSIPKANVSGTLTIRYAAPNRAKVTLDLGDHGITTQVIVGDEAYELSSLRGTRKLNRKERDRLMETISLRNTFLPTQVYSSIVNRGRELVGQEPCYRVELKKPNGGDVDQVFYSIDSGLPMRTITLREGLNGQSTIDSVVSDYQSFDGIQVGTKIVQSIPSLNVVYEIDIESVDFNEPIADSTFAIPTLESKNSAKTKS